MLEIRSLRLLSLCVTETKWHGPPSKVLSSYKERGLQKDGGCKDSPNKLSHVSLVMNQRFCSSQHSCFISIVARDSQWHHLSHMGLG